MFSSRYSAFSIVGFALLASACTGDLQPQKPMQIDAIDQGESAEHGEEKELTADVDAGSAEADAGSQVEADAGSQGQADAGEEPEEDAGEDEKALPCEVQKLLKTRCQGCHSAQAKNGVPLMSFEDLMAPSKADPNATVFERVLARMISTERPMPPVGKGMPVTEAELAQYQAWMDDGTPGEACEP